MTYLPISILAYFLNGGVIVVDKILLNTSFSSPWVYTFYINFLGLLSLILLPFGFRFNFSSLFPAVISGVATAFAMLLFFQSLRIGEASVSAPMVGALNPLFTLILGSIFLNQVLSKTQLMGFFIIIIGAAILSFNLWYKHLRVNKQLILMVSSGLLFAISYLFLKQVFEGSNFITGLILSRLFSGLTVLCFLFFKKVREQIFKSGGPSISPLLLSGQSMGAGAGLLLAYATSLTTPALVNALFGVQYLVIFAAALILGKNHPNLLDERLEFNVLTQKILGAVILSFGIYILGIS